MPRTGKSRPTGVLVTFDGTTWRAFAVQVLKPGSDLSRPERVNGYPGRV